MNTKALFFTAVCATATACLSAERPAGAISRDASKESETSDSDQLTATNSAGQSYSLSEVAGQLRELQRAVEDTLPMLDAVTGTNSASGAPVSTGGALAGILGNILRGSTNQNQAPESGSSRGTNTVFGNILRGVLGTNAPAAPDASQSTLTDLVALRQQLQTLTPILQRLDGGSLSRESIAQPTGQSSTNGLTPTGRESDSSEE